MSRENWIREDGLGEDKLFKTHKSLRHKWQWSDIKHIKYTRRPGGGFSEKEMDSSQVSFAKIYPWEFEAIHWHSEYEARVSYEGEEAMSKKGIRTRLEAQVEAEGLAAKWIEQIKKDYSKLVTKSKVI